jgi:D-alanine-D-alanine ligase
MSQTTLTAELSDVERATMLKLARDTYRAVGCEGFARIDFLVAGDRVVVSEVNTIPGFTSISMFPALPSAGGYDFAAVCRRVVDLALERDATRMRHRLTPDLPR